MTQYKPGDLIGKKYLVERSPLRGGMGIVYLCYDTVTGDPIALKTFQSNLLSATVIERFREEALTWVKLDKHPHIVRCYWMQELDDQPFIGMEMIPSSEDLSADLGDWIRQRRLSLATILSFAIQICRGMQHAHAKLRLVHCDLKPSNILVTQNQNVKVTDFGLARAVQVMGSDALTDTPAALAISPHALGVHRGVAGTPPYMPPEQWRAEPLDVRADIYAFGCVLYEMLTGRPPFEVHFMPNSPQRVDEWLRAWQSQHEETPPPALPSTLPHGLEEIVHSCLAKERSDRFSDFGAMEGALATLYQLVTGKVYAALPSIAELTAWELKDKGGSLNNLGRPKEALVALDQALAIDPGMADAWLNKGASLGALEQHAEALAAFNQALVIDPTWALAWVNKGRGLDALGRLEEALAAYDRALAIDPNLTGAWVNKGGSLVDLGRLEEALATYDHALALDPNHAQTYSNRASIHHALRQYEQALADYNRAIVLDPTYARAYLNIGVILGNEDRLTEALPYFEIAAQLGDRQGAQYAAQVRQMLRMETAPATNLTQQALAAFQQANSVEAMQQAVTRFPLLQQADFITAIEQAIAQQTPPEHRSAFTQRLTWLHQIANTHHPIFSPIALRLDVAAPNKVIICRPFEIAVAVRQPSSPHLEEVDLPVVSSGHAQVTWPQAEPYLRLHVHVNAPECEIIGASNIAFRLYRSQDSAIFYFLLTPKAAGKIGIVITLYQEEDFLSSARIHTLVRKQKAGRVKVEIKSENLYTKSSDQYTVAEGRAALERELDQHQRNLMRLYEQKAIYGAGEAPLHLLNQIEHEDRSIQRLQAELAG